MRRTRLESAGRGDAAAAERASVEGVRLDSRTAEHRVAVGDATADGGLHGWCHCAGSACAVLRNLSEAEIRQLFEVNVSVSCVTRPCAAHSAARRPIVIVTRLGRAHDLSATAPPSSPRRLGESLRSSAPLAACPGRAALMTPHSRCTGKLAPPSTPEFLLSLFVQHRRSWTTPGANRTTPLMSPSRARASRPPAPLRYVVGPPSSHQPPLTCPATVFFQRLYSGSSRACQHAGAACHRMSDLSRHVPAPPVRTPGNGSCEW